MSTQILKDRWYKTIGYVDTQADGKLVFMDASYNVLGYYDPETDETRDSSYNSIGYGNLGGTFYNECTASYKGQQHCRSQGNDGGKCPKLCG